MKARGTAKKFCEIIARNVEGGADSAPPPPALLGLINKINLFISVVPFFASWGELDNQVRRTVLSTCKQKSSKEWEAPIATD